MVAKNRAKSTDRHKPKQGRQQKGDAAQTDISRNRAVSKNVRGAGAGRVRKTDQNFRVFRFIKHRFIIGFTNPGRRDTIWKLFQLQ